MTAPLRLTCERLDDRDNPSGNVSAFVSGNDLFVIGDAVDNQVAVTQDQFGNVFVTGFNGTTVNGQVHVYVGTGNPSRISVQLGGGNDSIEIARITAGGIDVTTGDGNDRFAIHEVTANTVQADMGAGDDLVEMRYVTAWYGAAVSGGTGVDTAFIGPIQGPANFQQFEQAFPG